MMRRNSGVLIAASLLLGACGAVNPTSATNSESVIASSITVSPISPPSEPVATPATQASPDNESVAIERSVSTGSTTGSPSYLAEPVPVSIPAPPSTITPLIVAQSAEVESASLAPAPVAAPVVTAPPTTQAPVITAPPVTAPVVTIAPVIVPPLVPSGLPIDSASASRFVSDINGLRARNGLPGLARSAELDSLALGWARTMAADGNMRHSSIIHSLINQGTWTGAAENIGYGSTETIVFNALVKSEPHRINMVNPAYTHVGVAVVVAPDPGGNHALDLIWTAHLFVG